MASNEATTTSPVLVPASNIPCEQRSTSLSGGKMTSETASSSTSLPPHIFNSLTSVMLKNNAISRIQATLSNELSSSGWIDEVHEFVKDLLRSGECSSYGELMEKVVQGAISGPSIKPDSSDPNSPKGSSSVAKTNIKIPDQVIHEGLRTVRKELESCCEIILNK